MADWDLNALLLRAVEFQVRAGNWQRGGGKARRPKPIDLPETKTRVKASGPNVAEKLRNLGLLSSTTGTDVAATGT